MRGGVAMEDLLHIYSNEDVDMLMNIISENIELTKQAQMPLL
jgi:hypothetical protein